IASMKATSHKISELENKVGEIEDKLREIQLIIPNFPHSSVKIGTDNTQNTEVLNWGESKKLSFKAKEHTEIGENLRIFDMARGAKLSGSGFVVFGGGIGARLVRALINFMLDQHTQNHGYVEFS